MEGVTDGCHVDEGVFACIKGFGKRTVVVTKISYFGTYFGLVGYAGALGLCPLPHRIFEPRVGNVPNTPIYLKYNIFVPRSNLLLFVFCLGAALYFMP